MPRLCRGLAAALLACGPSISAAAAPPVAPAAAAEVEDWRDILRLDEAARDFFRQRVRRQAAASAQVDAIIEGVLGRDGLGFRYRADGNFGARETFHRREGNCVAFSLLIVAVAREYGLTARFNEQLRSEPYWDRVGQVVAEYRHLNVIVRTESGKVLVDLLPAAGAGVAPTVGRPVSDAEAFALFCSNRGVELLGQGRSGEARPLLERATRVAPGYAPGWVNLGNLHSLGGDTAAAQACYERALREDPREVKALASLAQIHRAAGRLKQAVALERKSERYRQRNPYYLAALARRDLEAGRFAAAEKRLRRALALKDDDPELFRLAANAAERLGRGRDAARWSARAEAVEADRDAGAAAGR